MHTSNFVISNHQKGILTLLSVLYFRHCLSLAFCCSSYNSYSLGLLVCGIHCAWWNIDNDIPCVTTGCGKSFVLSVKSNNLISVGVSESTNQIYSGLFPMNLPTSWGLLNFSRSAVQQQKMLSCVAWERERRTAPYLLRYGTLLPCP